MTHREMTAWNAAKNRRELIEARFTRRDLAKMGLLTGAGYLVVKSGLSARADQQTQSPRTRAFIEPLPIMPNKQTVPSLTPTPTAEPNTAEGEGRTRSHQAFSLFAPQKFYEIHQRAAKVSMSPDLPLQTIWGYDGMAPGPTFIAKYGDPILVRQRNDLPPRSENGGFGLPSVTTHLHNGHTPSESDGFPCDFFERKQFYDQHYPNVLAGFKDTHPPDGDPNEMMSFLWYHDHRIAFTSQNVYKGLAGFYLLFDDRPIYPTPDGRGDTGDETTGFGLPSGEFDVPMMFADKVFDPRTGLLFFDLFNLDGILGDKFLVNGKIQPFFRVHPRRYRFRWLNTGPSRFLELFLTDLNALSAHQRFWQISHDGNLLPKPLQVESVGMSVAERSDVIIDFGQFPPGSNIYIENRLEQKDGRGPTNRILPAGQGNLLLRFEVVLDSVPDGSADPETITRLLAVPSRPQNVVKRNFRFDRENGMWAINGRLMDDDCETIGFQARQNTTGNEGEIWTFQNNSGGWQHPIHPHFEEFVILTRNGQPPPPFEVGRDDVARLNFNEEIVLFRRHRDFLGRYPLHCHNVIHEDHAMMLRFDIEP
jgi:FtsP/CotA-like multicopper oxidase with cupredoxin domain